MDGDFIDVDWLSMPTGTSPDTLLVLFHGLEGSSQSHYAEAFADFCHRNGLAFAVPHFRGCSGELNLAPRAYHSGDWEEVGWILSRFRKHWKGRIVAAGVSLGGNALLRWAQEHGDEAGQVVDAIAAVSAPLDLRASGHAIGIGFNRWIYTRMFLKTMVPKALKKLDQYPGLFSRESLLKARTLYAFDDIVTAPLHGFKGTDDYWTRASAKPHLVQIRIPALILNAQNDPFVPADCLPAATGAGRYVTLWQPESGGHVGFPEGSFPAHVTAMPEAVGKWLTAHLSNTTMKSGEVHG